MDGFITNMSQALLRSENVHLRCGRWHDTHGSPASLSAEDGALPHPQVQKWSVCCPQMAFYPRCSMYGIFTYIYPKNNPNVGKYSIHGASGHGEDEKPSTLGAAAGVMACLLSL